LFVARVEVREHYLIRLFADDIREDLDLPYLDLASRRQMWPGLFPHGFLARELPHAQPPPGTRVDRRRAGCAR
jgi:hypothetical protein